MDDSSTKSTPQPELRAGVTWRNPENLTPDRIPAGYRLLTSVEQTIPDDALTTGGPGALKPTKYPGKTLLKGLGDINTYVTRQPLPPEALPAPAKFPKLRTGVTYRNPEGVLPEHMPSGFRLLTSVEDIIPTDGQTPWGKVADGGFTWGDTQWPGTKIDDSPRQRNTYLTRTPFPAAALPAVEPQLPGGISWLGKPLDQESLDEGWRRLCTADAANPGDLEFLFLGRWSRSTAPVGAPRTITCTPSEPFGYRTKAPLPKFPNPSYVSSEPEITTVRASLPGVAVYYRNGVPIFPPLPAGAEWINPEGHSPEKIQVDKGWRPLCTLDESYPDDHEYYYGFDGVWKPGLPCREKPKFVGWHRTYRTKAPIPQPKLLQFPPLPAGVTWHNPLNFTPEKFGVSEGWRPLCSLDDPAPADVDYYDVFACAWCVAAFTSGSPKNRWGIAKENYRTKAPIPQPKPVTVSAGTIDGHPVTTSRQKLPRYAAEAFFQIAAVLGVPSDMDPLQFPALVRRRQDDFNEVRGLVFRQSSTLEELSRMFCGACVVDRATLVETAKSRCAELASVHQQLEDASRRIAELDRQNEYLRQSRDRIVKISGERGHTLRQVNDIIDGNLDPSSGVHLTDTAMKVAALHKIKSAAEFEVADLKKANENQTRVLDEIAKLVGDESGTLPSLLPAVQKSLTGIHWYNRTMELGGKIRSAVEQLQDRRDLSHGVVSAAYDWALYIVRNAAK